MRPTVRYLILLLALAFVGTAYADSRTDARTHYQTGVKLYNGGDYKGAIREFSAAQQLMPADLNNYNLALCYDKLGDPDPAIQYYRAFLDKQPGSDKKAEIEASISRLEAAAKSVASKKAEELRKIDEARIKEEARKAAEDARKEEARRAAEEDARKAEEAKKAAEAKKTEPVVGPPAGPTVGPSVGPDPSGFDRTPRGTGSTGSA